MLRSPGPAVTACSGRIAARAGSRNHYRAKTAGAGVKQAAAAAAAIVSPTGGKSAGASSSHTPGEQGLLGDCCVMC
jgi:hypothetical protein